MAYSLEKLPAEPIIIATIGADFDLAKDWEPYNAELNALLNTLREPAFYVTDARGANLGIDDVAAVANMTTRGSKPLLKHPNIRETLVVTSSTFLKLAARGLSSVTFGSLSIKTFEDVETCLRYCRQ